MAGGPAAPLADRAPRMETDPDTGVTRWRLGDRWLLSPGAVSHAGWKHFPPRGHRRSRTCSPPAGTPTNGPAGWTSTTSPPRCSTPTSFLRRAHDHGTGRRRPEARHPAHLERVRQRLRRQGARPVHPVAAVPFWDIDASIAEMQRSAEAGHKGVLWAATLAKHGLPRLPIPTGTGSTPPRRTPRCRSTSTSASAGPRRSSPR